MKKGRQEEEERQEFGIVGGNCMLTTVCSGDFTGRRGEQYYVSFYTDGRAGERVP